MPIYQQTPPHSVSHAHTHIYTHTHAKHKRYLLNTHAFELLDHVVDRRICRVRCWPCIFLYVFLVEDGYRILCLHTHTGRVSQNLAAVVTKTKNTTIVQSFCIYTTFKFSTQICYIWHITYLYFHKICLVEFFCYRADTCVHPNQKNRLGICWCGVCVMWICIRHVCARVCVCNLPFSVSSSMTKSTLDLSICLLMVYIVLYVKFEFNMLWIFVCIDDNFVEQSRKSCNFWRCIMMSSAIYFKLCERITIVSYVCVCVYMSVSQLIR